ncbi:MAG: hypothetical protein H5T24_12025 [Bacteroidales bacterium]|nr:hypothetical protein [Bacteroidales bacterium]
MKASKTHTSLLRQYYAMCRELGIKPEEQEAIRQGYGVNSIGELDNHQLIELIGKLHGDAHRWRRRVMAVIGAYLRRINYTENADTIKAVACRAAGYHDFNRIPVSRLREVYYEFLRRNQTADRVANEVAHIEFSLSNQN